MADANQQSQNIVAEAVQKAHEMIANAQKQSQDMVAEARQKSQDMITEATERSRSMILEATERSQKMVFVAETKAAAAIDTYNTMVNKANSQSKQFKSLLQSQLSLYDNFDAEYAVEQMVQPKLNAVKTAEPVLEAKAEPVVAGTDDAVATVVEAGVAEPVKAETATAEAKTAAEVKPSQENLAEAAEDNVTAEAGKEDPVGANFNEAAKADAAAAENANLSEDDKSSPGESNGFGGMRKPLFSRFNPRGPMVFNRNGFPRKNADLRVALSELQKTAEPKPQSVDAKPETINGEVKTEPGNAEPKPEGSKES
jgi:cell division septum initiation protein DivIVA